MAEIKKLRKGDKVVHEGAVCAPNGKLVRGYKMGIVKTAKKDGSFILETGQQVYREWFADTSFDYALNDYEWQQVVAAIVSGFKPDDIVFSDDDGCNGDIVSVWVDRSDGEIMATINLNDGYAGQRSVSTLKHVAASDEIHTQGAPDSAFKAGDVDSFYHSMSKDEVFDSLVQYLCEWDFKAIVDEHVDNDTEIQVANTIFQLVASRAWEIYKLPRARAPRYETSSPKHLEAVLESERLSRELDAVNTERDALKAALEAKIDILLRICKIEPASIFEAHGKGFNACLSRITSIINTHLEREALNENATK